MLQIVSEPVKPTERRIIPACLDARAPIDYRILDESGEPVPLTLVGYRLVAGRCYQLAVNVGGDPDAALLRFLTPRTVADVVGESKESYSQNGHQCLKFELSERSTGFSKFFYFSRAGSIDVRIEFKNGRDPFFLSVPIVISKSIWVNLLPLFLPSAYDLLKQVILPSDGFRLSSLGYMLAVGVVLTISLWILDQYLLYRKASKFFGDLCTRPVPDRR